MMTTWGSWDPSGLRHAHTNALLGPPGKCGEEATLMRRRKLVVGPNSWPKIVHQTQTTKYSARPHTPAPQADTDSHAATPRTAQASMSGKGGKGGKVRAACSCFPAQRHRGGLTLWCDMCRAARAVRRPRRKRRRSRARSARACRCASARSAQSSLMGATWASTVDPRASSSIRARATNRSHAHESARPGRWVSHSSRSGASTAS